MGKADYQFARTGLIGTLNKMKFQWFDEQGSDPGLLYHYTTPQGLLGILSTKRIWASNLRYMNDYSELDYARGLIVEIVRSKHNSSDSPVIVDFLTAMEAYIETELDHDVYGVCFCQDGNLLSQWRTYAATGGYSIEFQVEKMYAAHMPDRFLSQAVEKLYQRDDLNRKFCPSLKRVVYEESIQRNLIGAALEEFCRYFTTVNHWWRATDLEDHIIPLTDEEIDSVKELAKHVFGEVLIEYIFCFKSPTFKEEQEWRIIYTPGAEEIDKLKFRASGNYIVPYIELDLTDTGTYVADTFPISQIVHGPTLDPVLTKRSLQKLLKQHGYLETQVVGSGIPLRF